MKDRINRLMNAEGLTSSRLADEIGVQRSSVSHLLSGRNNPSYEFIQKLLTRFPRLNAEWIILGSGPMYKDVRQADLFQATPAAVVDSPVPVTGPDIPVKEPANDLFRTTEESGQGEKAKTPDPVPEKASRQDSRQPEPMQVIVVYSDGSFQSYHHSGA